MNILNYTELVGGKKNGSPHDYPITKTHDDQHDRSTIERKLMAINDLTYSTIMDHLHISRFKRPERDREEEILVYVFVC